MVIDRHVFRQADFIQRALDNLAGALRDGSLLVVLVVLMFLANLRASLITLIALPISLMAAVLGMRYFGFTLNSMSLGGLAIAIGELVDDAIIDVENVVRRLRENSLLPDAERRPTLAVVYRASREIRGSVVFATIIVILVFLPLFALESVEGRLLWPLGFAYIVALAASLVVALTVTPALCSLLLPKGKSILKGHEPWRPGLCCTASPCIVR
jgi:Cu/Ag efflux pump CusA